MLEKIEQLEKIPIIFSVDPIEFTLDFKNQIEGDLGEDKAQKALVNSKDINIFKIVYQSQGHRVVGYIIEPKRGENLPCIVYNRGGTGEFGSIQKTDLFLRLARYAISGYLVITTQYSGNGGSQGIDEVGGSDLEDVLNLYEILKQLPNVDIARIGVYGPSRGGMMTYKLLAQVDWIKAVVISSGIADFYRLEKMRPDIRDRMKKHFKLTRSAKKQRSALYWTDRFPKDVPILLMHGSDDKEVSVLDSIDMSKKLHEQGIPFRLVIFEGGDHALTQHSKEKFNQSINWFNKYV